MAIEESRRNEIKRKAIELQDKSLAEIVEMENIALISEISELRHISGAIILNSEGKYIIYINETENGRRQRFTLAHELGHYFFHQEYLGNLKGIIDNKDSSYLFRATSIADISQDDDSRRREEEANLFAVELLMPEDRVRQSWEKINDIKSLAEIFEVSSLAMAYRLDNLKLTD